MVLPMRVKRAVGASLQDERYPGRDPSAALVTDVVLLLPVSEVPGAAAWCRHKT